MRGSCRDESGSSEASGAWWDYTWALPQKVPMCFLTFTLRPSTHGSTAAARRNGRSGPPECLPDAQSPALGAVPLDAASHLQALAAPSGAPDTLSLRASSSSTGPQHLLRPTLPGAPMNSCLPYWQDPAYATHLTTAQGNGQANGTAKPPTSQLLPKDPVPVAHPLTAANGGYEL